MQDDYSSKQHLIKTYMEIERQTGALRRLVESNENEINSLKRKIEMAEETNRLATDAKNKQKELDEYNTKLERIAAKAENLAARENSRQNSTPEVRQINQDIETALDQVHKLERHASQLTMDASYTDHEIQTKMSDFQDFKESATKKLQVVYANIQQVRKDICQTRFENLNTYLQKQDRLTQAEIEYQKLSTTNALLKQFVAGTQAEVGRLQDPNGTQIIQAEFEKLGTVSASIAPHEQISPDELQRAKQQCESKLMEIKAIEEKIMASINEMAQAEDQQDDLTRQLHEEQTKNDEYRTLLRQEEMMISEQEARILEMKEKDANKLDDAREQIDRLTHETMILERNNKEKETRITKLRSGDISSAVHVKSNSPMDIMRARYLNDTKDLQSQIEQLQNLEQSLRSANAQRLLGK